MMGLGKCISFQIWLFWVSMLVFRGVNLHLVSLSHGSCHFFAQPWSRRSRFFDSLASWEWTPEHLHTFPWPHPQTKTGKESVSQMQPSGNTCFSCATPRDFFLLRGWLPPPELLQSQVVEKNLPPLRSITKTYKNNNGVQLWRKKRQQLHESNISHQWNRME